MVSNYELAEARSEINRHHRDFSFISHQVEMIELILKDIDSDDEDIKAIARRVRKIRNTVG